MTMILTVFKVHLLLLALLLVLCRASEATAALDSTTGIPAGETVTQAACSACAAAKDTENTTNSVPHQDSTTSHQQALVEWLVSKGGFFNDKVKFQPLFPGGPNGIFATADLAKNETVLVVPQACLLTSDLGEGPSYSICDTTRHLVQEYHSLQTSGQSDFAPFVKYIFEQKQYNRLPAAWSELGQTLMELLIGDELEPQGVTDIDFWSRPCPTREERRQAHHDLPMRQLYTDAYRTVISRSWNDVMIPIYDMFNHRNGHYHNLDQITSAHEENDVVIVTLRDVSAGEQLYISYNECHDDDCDGIKYTYISPHIMKDYGFVEQYPQRWWFTSDLNDHDSGVTIELEQDEATGNITLTWITDEPNRNELSFLRGHLHRQQAIHQELVREANKLDVSHERETLLAYHQAIMTALEMAIQEAGRRASRLPTPAKDCVLNADGSLTCTYNTKGRYDDLLESDGKLRQTGDDPANYDLCSSDNSQYMGEAEYEALDEIKSFYQTIAFEHNYDIDDTCLYLSGWLQTCTSWRPQYHESVVHIPASFLDNVTRVIYLGGGDNMLLHEVLKYSDSLEMVLGMELDQHVVRQSFKNLGNQPHFDNPKVQWWFGDATKSLNLLPREYFGTFDLVIVDLQTNVIETLQVTPTKNIMDVALDLLKPDGILSRNEDYYPRRSFNFAKYEVDLELLDVPMLCQQSITMGSKTLDFLAKKPKNHGVETLYLNKNPAPFNDWFNYRNNLINKQVDDMAQEDDTFNGNHGVHLILEVENASPEGSAETVRQSISKAMSQAGLAEMSTPIYNEDTTVFFLFQEGYLLAQFWPEENYVGFDLKLWSRFDLLESIKSNLITAVQGVASASFRIVTGGMFGLQGEKKAKAETETNPSKLKTKVEQHVESTKVDALETIVKEAISLVPSKDSIVAVICPEQAVSCGSLEALFKRNVHFNRKVIPVYTCRDLTDDTMLECEKETLTSLMKDIRTVGGKLGGIIFDAAAPKAMGQILHTLFSDKSNRLALLQRDYVLCYASKGSSPSWQRAFLERFQTQFDPFSPALRAQAFFNSTTDSMELGVFSSGNPRFYATLVNMLERVEQETGLGWEVRKVDDGVIGYIAEFHPRVIPTNADYDKTDALGQWSSQSPVGQQTILQFGIQATLEKLEEGEIVLVEYNRDVWKGEWLPGRVVKEVDQGKYVVELEGESEMELERASIRRLDFSADIDVMDQVLIRRGSYWSQGAIIDKTPIDGTFKVRRFDSNGDVMTVRRMDLVPRVESSEGSRELPSLMTVNLSDAVTSSLQSLGIRIDIDEDVHIFWGIGSGCVIVAFWSNGSAIVTWDGKTHLDVSYFTETEDKAIRKRFVDGIIKAIPMLVVVSRDDHPRGYGRVCNFSSELKNKPRWVEAAEAANE